RWLCDSGRGATRSGRRQRHGQTAFVERLYGVRPAAHRNHADALSRACWQVQDEARGRSRRGATSKRRAVQTLDHSLKHSVAALVVASPRVPSAQTTTVKLASVVPEISIWANSLRQMATEVSQQTGGRVTLTVFLGGSQGDEPTVLRKMRLDALQAAALTGI